MENVKEGTTGLDIAKLKKNREELMRFFRAFRSPAEEPLKLIVGGQGNCACTDGKAIYLPVGVVAGLDDDRDTALALSLHELGHVLYTDFEPQADAIRETAKDWKQKYENDHPAHPDAKVSGKALEQGIQLVFNAIEDGRIEALMASDGATGAAALFNGLLTSTLPEILKLGLGQAGAARELAAKEARIIAKSGGFMGLGMLAVFTATNIRNKFPPLADPVRSIGLEKARLVTAKVLAAWASAKSGRPAAGIEADLASLPKAGFFLNGKSATDSWLIFEIVKMCSDSRIRAWLAEAYRVIGEELCEECLEEDDDAQQEGQSQQGQSQQGQSQQDQSQQGQSQQGQSQQDGNGQQSGSGCGSGKPRQGAQQPQQGGQPGQWQPQQEAGMKEASPASEKLAEMEAADKALSDADKQALDELNQSAKGDAPSREEIEDALNERIKAAGEDPLKGIGIPEELRSGAARGLSQHAKSALAWAGVEEHLLSKESAARRCKEMSEEGWRQYASEHSEEICKLGQKLRRELEGMTRRLKTRRSAHGSVLHKLAVPKVASGLYVRNPFAEKEVTEGLATHVVFIGDNSGSMGHNRGVLRLGLAMLANAVGKFESDKLRMSIIAFSDEYWWVKRASERFGAKTLAKYPEIGDSDTNGEPAVAAAAMELAKDRRAQRKIIAILTDGCWSTPNGDYSYLRELGIECYGIMLGDSPTFSGTPGFTKSLFVRDESELPVALTGLFTEFLHGSKVKRNR